MQLATNLGGRWATRVEVLSAVQGAEAQWGIAARYLLLPELAFGVEFAGSSRFSGRADEDAAEGRAFAEVGFSRWRLQGGWGMGLYGGIGVPRYRAFVGATYAPLLHDRDGDGLKDDLDDCVDVKEDYDGYLDEDGCRDADNDGDGLVDERDRCPDEAEDVDGFEDEDGCLDADNDDDGVDDLWDSCPMEPEDPDGDRDDDGCPEYDRDGDDIPDEKDKCPTEMEDYDGYADGDGCPEEDADGDGIPDEKDFDPPVQ